MDGRKRRANYMKQGGLKMYAPWVIWLIAFVKMIYLYAQIGQKGITFYAAALFTILPATGSSVMSGSMNTLST